MKAWKFRLGIVAVFALGIVVGAVATGLVVRYRFSHFGFGKPEQAVSHIMKRLDRELNLSEEQHRAIEPIVLDSFTKMRAMRAKLTPEVEALVEQTGQRVKPHLNPDQQKQLDAHNAEVIQRWRMFSGPGMFGPPAAQSPAATPPGK